MEGIFWATLGAGLLSLTLIDRTSVDEGVFRNNFARRWDGECGGWTRGLATFHIATNLGIWLAYVVIAVAIARLHPIIHRIASAWITVSLIVSVFVTCGATHLLAAYVVINPIFVFDAWFRLLTGGIGLAGALFISHNLVTAFDAIAREKKRLQEFERHVEGR